MRSGHSTCFGIEEGQRPMTFEIRKFRDGTQRVGMGRRVAEGGLCEQTPLPRIRQAAP